MCIWVFHFAVWFTRSLAVRTPLRPHLFYLPSAAGLLPAQKGLTSEYRRVRPASFATFYHYSTPTVTPTRLVTTEPGGDAAPFTQLSSLLFPPSYPFFFHLPALPIPVIKGVCPPGWSPFHVYCALYSAAVIPVFPFCPFQAYDVRT